MMGFSFRGIHSRTFNGLVVKTVNNQLLPRKRSRRITVPGRDGEYIFEDGYNNKLLEFQCYLAKGRIEERRLLAREIADWLSGKGDLVLDGENDKTYKVVSTVNNIDLSVNQAFDTFQLTFETEPFQLGSHKTITVDNPLEVTLVNSGTVPAETVITITGEGNVSVSLGTNTFSLTDMSGKVNLDSKRMLVYTDPMENRLNFFTGEFLKVPPGESILEITGSVSQITINYCDTYI